MFSAAFAALLEARDALHQDVSDGSQDEERVCDYAEGVSLAADFAGLV